jgi:diadenosine tetraphosphate (Ap4A) HIT family hydrolase
MFGAGTRIGQAGATMIRDDTAGWGDDGPLCADNEAAERGDDPWAVARLATGYVRLNRTQYYRGATFFVAKACVAELHELGRAGRDAHLAEMGEVAEALCRAFGPRKLNHEALGNSVPHLHWWLTPRYSGDPWPRRPIWENPDFVRLSWTGGLEPDDAERAPLKGLILDALGEQQVTIERRFP